ncbi:hypothetical protein HMN09_00860900 [Mycena chlorophos]|uniref:Uncharacterized protein n=1 Tax=Mycena chlorophos TaxID=658473 RepID=A0A8H6SSF7_MYCCL|nr:hypothetical protein HMN09_00860900 [Mycena chlorophos]
MPSTQHTSRPLLLSLALLAASRMPRVHALYVSNNNPTTTSRIIGVVVAVVIIVLVVLCLCTARRQQRRFAAGAGGGPGFGYFSGAPAGVSGAPPPLWKPRRWMPPTDQAGYNPGAPNADASGSVPPPYSPAGAKMESGGGFGGAGAQHYPPPPGPPPQAHVHNGSTSGGFVGGFRPNTSA